MTLSIMLTEADLLGMSSELRDGLLHWYFDERKSRPLPPELAQAQEATEDDGSRRVTFAKLVAAGLLKTGQKIYCRKLKRQQNGGSKFIEGAQVSSQGANYAGREFSNPSTLAVAMVKQSGGKPTSLNGFDYLFVHSENGKVPLKTLRDQLMGQGERELRERKIRRLAEGAVQDSKEYGQDTEIEDHLPYIRAAMEREENG